MMGHMRYITATLGAILVYAGIVSISCVVNCFLPLSLRGFIVIPMGFFTIWGTPAILIGIVAGSFAAMYSFRSSLRLAREEAEARNRFYAEFQGLKQPMSYRIRLVIRILILMACAVWLWHGKATMDFVDWDVVLLMGLVFVWEWRDRRKLSW